MAVEAIQSSLPGVRVVHVAHDTLLGAPIGDSTSISATITAKFSWGDAESHDAYTS